MAFTHLLVPTDFSEPANNALRHAIEEVGLHHPKLTLLHVLPADTQTDVHYVTGAPAATGRLRCARRRARRRLGSRVATRDCTP